MRLMQENNIESSEIGAILLAHCKDKQNFQHMSHRQKIDNLKKIMMKNERLFEGDEHHKTFSQSYPNPNDSKFPRQMMDELIWTKRHSFINKTTKIVSMGSCFAIEIAKWLQSNSFSYLISDSSPVTSEGLFASSAGWGTIFNTPSAFQTISWAFNPEDRPKVIYQRGDEYLDPLIEEFSLTKDQLQNYDKIVGEIISDSHTVLKNADVLILTVGLNEVFQLLPTKYYFHRTPWKFNPAYFKAEDLSVEQNVSYLLSAIDLLRQHNPGIKIILSVSPVPLLRSYHKNRHVAESTSISKAVLRLAVDEVVRSRSDVYYFGSFETVMYPGQSISMKHDERHVRFGTVDKIMNTFVQSFCDETVRTDFAYNDDAKDVHKGIINFVQNLPKEVRENKLLKQFEDAMRMYLPSRTANTELSYQFFRTISAHTQLQLNKSVNEVKRNRVNRDVSCKRLNALSVDGILNISNMFTKDEMLEIENFNDTARGICRDSKKIVRLSDTLKSPARLDGSGIFDYLQDDIPGRLIFDILNRNKIKDLAEQYLGEIRYVSVAGWRSLPVNKQSGDGASMAAQQYHYDLDSIGGFLKIFIALVEIDEDNGPFHFVKGTHNALPKLPRSDGRFTDEEIANMGLDVCLGISKPGDLLIADTIGLHKGGKVILGKRDILQVEIGNTLYGKPREFFTPPNFNSWIK